MKKILTLLLIAGSFMAAQAQTSREEARRVILGGGGNRDNGNNRDGRDVILGDNGRNYPSSGNDRYEVDRINREYDAKIQSIRNNETLSRAEKERTIRQLERDRQQRLRQVQGGYRDRDYDNDRYERRDNGKHKGWYKKDKNKNWKKGKKDRDWDDD